jgi:hypothetical protein
MSLRIPGLVTLLIAGLLAAPRARAAEASAVLTARTPDTELRILPAGRAQLIDRRSGADLVNAAAAPRFASAIVDEKPCPLESVAAADRPGRIVLAFSGTDTTATLAVTARESWFVVEVVAVNGRPPRQLDFVNLPLVLKADPAEPTAACALALNLSTNVLEIPGPSTGLHAMCYSKLGLVGARVALVVCPRPRLRDVLKAAVSAADELPHSPIGGPWALDAPGNRGSYIIDVSGTTGPAQIDRWIAMLKDLGISQLDFHCGHNLRFGDYTPDPKVFPNGLADVRAMNEKLHAAGMMAGLHTYAHFIAKNSPFVTPVPNPGLAADVTCTLAGAVTADATTVPVTESTAGLSAVTGFFVRNSATIRIDDELILFEEARKEPPFGFARCRRGAHGTKATAHAAGAPVKHLKECFGLFVPDPDTPLFTDVIASTARAYNEGGFDMIYLDALDGSDTLGGGEWAWYYGSKFVFELARRLRKPALFEMSTFHHHLWYVRSRMGAWDAPARGPRPFIEIHRLANRDCARMFLPPHLGWWAIKNWEGIQPERTFPETLEYLCCRCIADGCGLSFVGFSPEAYAGSPANRRLGEIIGRYEELRRSGRVSEKLRDRLGRPFEEYILDSPPGGTPRFRPVRYTRHTINRLGSGEAQWTVNNAFPDQPLQVRVETLMSAGEYDSPESTVLEDFAAPALYAERQVGTSGSATLERVDAPVKVGPASGRFDAIRGTGPQQPWAMVGRRFSPHANLAGKALGFWVHGDGRGELLNLQVKSPLSAYGGVCDRYARIDFSGWKYIELIEPESDDIVRHDWPYMPHVSRWATGGGAAMANAYPAFHIHVSFEKIETMNLWYGDLPEGPVSCVLSPIKAVPLKECRVSNPSVTVAGRTLTFPVELASGQYLELRSNGDCRLYDARGNPTATVRPQGDVPALLAGDNSIGFAAGAADGPHPRVRVTVFSTGAPLE